MNLNIDKINGQIQTSGNQQLTALSYNIRQKSYNTMTVKVEMIDQNNHYLGTFEVLASIYRELSSCTIVQSARTGQFNGSSELSSADISLIVEGSSILIKADGIDLLTLDWCVQVQNDILTNE